MAWVRSRLRNGVKRYYVITRTKKCFAAGTNKTVAERIRLRYEELELLERHGIHVPGPCLWRLSDLKERDLEVNPEPSRVRRWRVLMAGFGDVMLDRITPAAVENFIRQRLKTAGPATVNRDRSVLAAALAMARRLRDESGYEGDPFEGVRALDEKRARRASVALTQAQVRKLLSLFEETPRMRAACELLLMTGSRAGERGIVSSTRDVLFYHSQKRGTRRSVRMTRKLRSVLGSDPVWSRRVWERQVKKFEIPTLRPHDLRHTAATLAFRAGRRVHEVQALLGHKSPAMAERLYIHLQEEPLEPVPLVSTRPVTRSTSSTKNRRRKRKKVQR